MWSVGYYSPARTEPLTTGLKQQKTRKK